MNKKSIDEKNIQKNKKGSGMSKEKKKTIIFTVILSLIAAVLLCLFAYDGLSTSGAIMKPEVKEIMNNFKKYYNSDKRTVIYYASTSCSWCALLTPELELISEDYDMDYYYVDTSKLPLKQRNEIMDKLGIKKHSTPITVVVEDGKVIDKLEGYVSGTDYVEFLKATKVLPEDAVYSDEQYLTFIDYEDYEDLINSSGQNIIVLGQTDCPHCIAIKPALNSVAGKYDLKINYINIDVLSEDDYSSFSKSLDEIEYNDPKYLEDGSYGTPLILVVKNGKVKNYISGERTTSQLVREFKKIGLISE